MEKGQIEMSVIGQSTRMGQSGLLAVAFTTPFMITVGSGGYAQAAYQETTGNNMFVSLEQPLSETDKDLRVFSGKVKAIKDTFGLGIDQISAIFAVSRPTVYTWLKGDFSRIQNKHRERAMSIDAILRESITEKNSQYLGKLLRRKLDEDAINLVNLLSQENIALDHKDSIIKSIEFKLEGIKRNEHLSLELSDNRALI